MKTTNKSFLFTSVSVLLITMILAPPAHAFRCGNKIVIENMHEQQVRKACGEPTTMRHLGYTVRAISLHDRHTLSDGFSVTRYPGYSYYSQEVVVTEYIYNFGPRKFMRRLLFEGGVLTSIETIGYGYRESAARR